MLSVFQNIRQDPVAVSRQLCYQSVAVSNTFRKDRKQAKYLGVLPLCWGDA